MTISMNKNYKTRLGKDVIVLSDDPENIVIMITDGGVSYVVEYKSSVPDLVELKLIDCLKYSVECNDLAYAIFKDMSSYYAVYASIKHCGFNVDNVSDEEILEVINEIDRVRGDLDVLYVWYE